MARRKEYKPKSTPEQRAKWRDRRRRYLHGPGHAQAVQVYTARANAKYYGLSGADNSLRPAEWMARLERVGWRCEECGTPAAETALGKLSLDHQRPMCRGGTNVAANVACLCLPCNIRKGAAWIDYNVRPAKVMVERDDEAASRIPHWRSSRAKAKAAKTWNIVVQTPEHEDLGILG